MKRDAKQRRLAAALIAAIEAENDTMQKQIALNSARIRALQWAEELETCH